MEQQTQLQKGGLELNQIEQEIKQIVIDQNKQLNSEDEEGPSESQMNQLDLVIKNISLAQSTFVLFEYLNHLQALNKTQKCELDHSNHDHQEGEDHQLRVQLRDLAATEITLRN